MLLDVTLVDNGTKAVTSDRDDKIRISMSVNPEMARLFCKRCCVLCTVHCVLCAVCTMSESFLYSRVLHSLRRFARCATTNRVCLPVFGQTRTLKGTRQCTTFTDTVLATPNSSSQPHVSMVRVHVADLHHPTEPTLTLILLSFFLFGFFFLQFYFVYAMWRPCYSLTPLICFAVRVTPGCRPGQLASVCIRRQHSEALGCVRPSQHST